MLLQMLILLMIAYAKVCATCGVSSIVNSFDVFHSW